MRLISSLSAFVLVMGASGRFLGSTNMDSSLLITGSLPVSCDVWDTVSVRRRGEGGKEQRRGWVEMGDTNRRVLSHVWHP